MDASPWEFKSPSEHNNFLKKQEKPKIVLFDSYIKTVKNSIGSNLFRNFYCKIGSKTVDVLEDGNLSCAKFVSSILYLFKLISDMHTTVSGTVADLQKSGWIQTAKPRVGTVIVWEAKKVKNGNFHKHIGFYIGNKRVISSSYEKHQPIVHHWTYGTKNSKPVRKVEQIFWNKSLIK
ncbi:MAG: hypothetical protein HYT61_02475 [Candidatus Yanofskybacteria bacterium]|nr:hypothetical protein [Candidatus Yanofskybacteria bacterium]